MFIDSTSGGSSSGSGGSADPPGLLCKQKWPLFGHLPNQISFEPKLIGIGTRQSKCKDLINGICLNKYKCIDILRQ